MAIRFVRRVRPLIVLAVLGAVVSVAPTIASATPHTDPSVTSVQKQLGTLALQNTQLVEQYNQAQVAVQQQEKAVKAAQAGAAQASATYLQAHALFAQIVQAQYETDSLGATGALLSSNSDTNYLDRLQALGMMSTHTAQVVAQVSDARDAAVQAATKARTLLSTVTSQRDALAAKRNTVSAQITKYQRLLASLTSAQQYAYQRAVNPSVAATATSAAKMKLTPAGSAAAQRAVQFALAQVGKPYVFGAAGPSAYDCSGLTMQAWRAGGVSLPHSAADQYNYGQHVSRDELAPGDLIFFYQPIGHVTIYIGDGLMVSAPTEGENVSVVPLTAFNGDYTGATRLS